MFSRFVVIVLRASRLPAHASSYGAVAGRSYLDNKQAGQLVMNVRWHSKETEPGLFMDLLDPMTGKFHMLLLATIHSLI